MDSILTFNSDYLGRIDRVLSLTFNHFFDILDISLIASFQELFFLFLNIVEIPIPQLFNKPLDFRQLLNSLQEKLIYQLLIVLTLPNRYKLNLIIIQILDSKGRTLILFVIIAIDRSRSLLVESALLNDRIFEKTRIGRRRRFLRLLLNDVTR